MTFIRCSWYFLILSFFLIYSRHYLYLLLTTYPFQCFWIMIALVSSIFLHPSSNKWFVISLQCLNLMKAAMPRKNLTFACSKMAWLLIFKYFFLSFRILQKAERRVTAFVPAILYFSILFSRRKDLIAFWILVHFLFNIFYLIFSTTHRRWPLKMAVLWKSFFTLPLKTELTYILLMELAHCILIFLFSFAIPSRWFKADSFIKIFLCPIKIYLWPNWLGQCLRINVFE